jgi:hypothetical protein
MMDVMMGMGGGGGGPNVMLIMIVYRKRELKVMRGEFGGWHIVLVERH